MADGLVILAFETSELVAKAIDPTEEVFCRIDTVLSPRFAKTMSDKPSPLVSPMATEVGEAPVEKSTFVPKLIVPDVELFRKVDIVLLPKLETPISNNVSPSISPTTIELGAVPADNVTGESQLITPTMVLAFRSTDTLFDPWLATAKSDLPS